MPFNTAKLVIQDWAPLQQHCSCMLLSGSATVRVHNSAGMCITQADLASRIRPVTPWSAHGSKTQLLLTQTATGIDGCVHHRVP